VESPKFSNEALSLAKEKAIADRPAINEKVKDLFDRCKASSPETFDKTMEAITKEAARSDNKYHTGLFNMVVIASEATTNENKANSLPADPIKAAVDKFRKITDPVNYYEDYEVYYDTHVVPDKHSPNYSPNGLKDTREKIETAVTELIKENLGSLQILDAIVADAERSSNVLASHAENTKSVYKVKENLEGDLGSKLGEFVKAKIGEVKQRHDIGPLNSEAALGSTQPQSTVEGDDQLFARVSAIQASRQAGEVGEANFNKPIVKPSVNKLETILERLNPDVNDVNQAQPKREHYNPALSSINEVTNSELNEANYNKPTVGSSVNIPETIPERLNPDVNVVNLNSGKSSTRSKLPALDAIMEEELTTETPPRKPLTIDIAMTNEAFPAADIKLLPTPKTINVAAESLLDVVEEKTADPSNTKTNNEFLAPPKASYIELDPNAIVNIKSESDGEIKNTITKKEVRFAGQNASSQTL